MRVNSASSPGLVSDALKLIFSDTGPSSMADTTNAGVAAYLVRRGITPDNHVRH